MRITTFWLILAVFFPGRIVGQANVNVPPDDPAYVYLDDLVAWGLVTSDISATKPYSRGDFAQLIAEARAAYDKNPAARGAPVVAYALQYLTDRFSDDIDALSADGASRRVQLRLIDELQLGYFNYEGERRTTAPNPRIDADIQPFIAYREGRTFREGQNLALESRHWFSLGDALGVYYQGRLFATDPRTSTGLDGDVNYETLRFYARLTKWNVNLLVGKDGMVWGTGARGNLMFSSNAKPVGSFKTLPLIQFSNQHPIRLPWILHGLGPMRYVLFISRLDEDRRDFARPYLVGLRLNFKSGKNSEFGFSHSYIAGGEGSPASFSLLDGVAEFFFIRRNEGFIFAFRGATTGGENGANHIMGVDFKLRFPGIRYAEFYNEIYFDDFTFNLSTTINRNIAYLGGFFLPRVTEDGRVSLRVEYTHTGSIWYGNVPFSGGFTFDRRIFGSDLGSAGNEVYTELRFRPDPETTWSAFADVQFRGVAGLEFLGPGADEGPDEKRLLLGGALTRRLLPNLLLRLEASYMKTATFANIAGDDRDDFFFGVTFRATDLGR